MSFLTLILKNLLRRRSRSLLTIIGISIGIAAVVALTSLAWGFERSWTNVYKARGTDLIVTKTATRSAVPAPFSVELQGEMRKMPHVREVAGLLTEVFSVESMPSLVVLGWEPGTSLWEHIRIVEGRLPSATARDELLLGTIAAEMLGKKVGDNVQIETTDFKVTGILSSSALAENGAAVLPLAGMQALTEREGMINFIGVRMEADTKPEEIEKLRLAIKDKFKGLTAFNPGTVAQSNVGIQIAKAMSLGTSIIALVVGAVGVMNTILMSVFERLREIGVLLAIGWRRGRILRMILMESLALSFVGGIVGCALGVAAVNALQATPWIRGKLMGEVSPSLLGVAMLIAFGLGALGGVYPAWVGSRMSPINALRHE
ncbi:MAG: ABC transporter permease [Chthoniobacteraceae bacterium]